jgi:Fe-S cluster assembly protein SufD
VTTPAAQSLLDHFEAMAERRPGHGVSWLENLRHEGLAGLRDAGLPTTKLEDWRFTSLAKLAQLELASAADAPAPDATIETARSLVGDAHVAVFVNGRLHAASSSLEALPSGVRLESLQRVLAEEPERVRNALATCVDVKRNVLAGTNLALFEDGAFVELASGAILDRPLHLMFAQVGTDAPSAVHPRVLVCAGAGSRACVVEHHIGQPGVTGLCNPVSELRLEADAKLEHVIVQDGPSELHWIGSLGIWQERDSLLRTTSLALGSKLARLDIVGALQGEGAHLEMNGLYLGRASQHLDHHTTIDHAVPHTTSVELYKGILDERARGVFHGRIHVRPDAQRIDAAQTNRTLLLSDRAQIDTKPQLEIYADDVKCSHGASIGQLDEEHLFYLRTRGLPEAEARAMLSFAFASEVVERLPLEPLRLALRERVLDWLPEEATR